jgi:hypothetical protein
MSSRFNKTPSIDNRTKDYKKERVANVALKRQICATYPIVSNETISVYADRLSVLRASSAISHRWCIVSGMRLFSKKTQELKKMVICMAAVGLCVAPSAAHAASFSNCTALRVKYPNGVAKSAATAQKQKNMPKVSAAIYKSNIKMDRGKDGTICEK